MELFTSIKNALDKQMEFNTMITEWIKKLQQDLDELYALLEKHEVGRKD